MKCNSCEKVSNWTTPLLAKRLIRSECRKQNDVYDAVKNTLQAAAKNINRSCLKTSQRHYYKRLASLSKVFRDGQPLFQPIDVTRGYIISGFLDNRDHRHKVIKAFVLLPFRTTKMLFCHIVCAGRVYLITGRLQFIQYYTPAHNNCVWQQYILHCPLSKSCDGVSLDMSVTSSECVLPTNLLKVHTRKPLQVPRKKIGVCLNTIFDLQSKDAGRLIQFVEITRMFGADVIYLYGVENVSSAIENILYYYVNNDVIQRHSWKIPEEISSVFYFAQVLQNNDCIYRHMDEVEYLLFIDLDELLLPLQHNNWRHLVDTLESTNASREAGFSFSRVNTLHDGSLRSKGVKSINNRYNFSYLDPGGWTNIHGRHSGGKMIVRPRRTLYVSVHSQDGSVKNFLANVHVDTQSAVIFHLRHNSDLPVRPIPLKVKSTINKVWAKSVPLLLSRMEKVFNDVWNRGGWGNVSVI